VYLSTYKNLTANDIISASIECDGEIIADFVTPPKIKSGELAEKVDEVYEAGRKDEQTKFWEIFQASGNRTNYLRLCSNGEFNDENFNPIYPITPVNSQQMFGSSSPNFVTDTKQPIVVRGTFHYCFNNSDVKKVRSIDLTNATSADALFYLARALEEITFVGSIPLNISVSYSTKLTHESLMSLINALADFSDDTSGTTHKVTLGSTNLAKLTEAEKDIMTQKGWQYS
jgi:hypothetical protein